MGTAWNETVFENTQDVSWLDRTIQFSKYIDQLDSEIPICTDNIPSSIAKEIGKIRQIIFPHSSIQKKIECRFFAIDEKTIKLRKIKSSFNLQTCEDNIKGLTQDELKQTSDYFYSLARITNKITNDLNKELDKGCLPNILSQKHPREDEINASLDSLEKFKKRLEKLGSEIRNYSNSISEQ